MASLHIVAATARTATRCAHLCKRGHSLSLPVASTSRSEPAGLSCAGSLTLIKQLSISSAVCSGHNKWSKIRHKKMANDTARSKSYSAISREIVNAVRSHPTHASSPETNARLASLLRKARDMDVPKDKIEATIKKAEAIGSGASGGTSIVYEALGASTDEGVPIALVIECMTDSPGRTRSKVKEAINKHGIRLSSTSHMFERKGLIKLLARPGTSFDDIFLAAIELGAEDVLEWNDAAEEVAGEGTISDTAVQIFCEPSNLFAISSALAAEPHNHTLHLVEPQMLPIGAPLRIRETPDPDVISEQSPDQEGEAAGWVPESEIERLDKFVELLEDGADCERVWSNIAGWPAR